MKTVLAIDLGAESGRVMAVHFDGRELQPEELHRFPNHRVTVGSRLYWDFLSLWREIQEGIARGRAYQPASLGVDTWGVDFALLDAQGELIGNPVHYRDARTEGMMERVFEIVPRAEVFAQTGIQFMPINTLYQLMSLAVTGSPQLSIAHTFLTSPDLLNYWLTGVKAGEFTIATTTQMFNPLTCEWAYPLLTELGLPTGIFPEIIQPGTRLGEFQGIPVIAPACHDTGNAVAAVPAETGDYAYISSGTWSLVGLEMSEPVINQAALEANVTNEGGVYGTFRLLKNVTGLWLLQQCRATWSQQSGSLTYGELVQLAEESTPFYAWIDPNDPAFLPPGDHPARVKAWCQASGQPVPEGRGAVVRCVLESLALEYRRVLDMLRQLTNRPIEVIHIVGGGTQNEMLSQMTANVTGLPVAAGPVEATVIGNALVQLIAAGELADIQEARRLVGQMGTMKRYAPHLDERWEAAYSKYLELTSQE
jgi:rhamnulokinase